MQTEIIKNEELKSRYTGGAIARSLMKWLSVFVSIITLTLALPAMMCWRERYECRHTYIDGRQLRFDGHALQLLGKFIAWVLLTLITLFIYGFWLSVKMKKWKIKHTHFADEPTEEFNGQTNENEEKTNRIASMTEEERKDYEEKYTERRKTAHTFGLSSIAFMFFFPPIGLILGIAGIVLGAIYKEKSGIRLSTVAASILATAIVILVVALILKSATETVIIVSCVMGAAAIIACVTAFIISKNWQSYVAQNENNEKEGA